MPVARPVHRDPPVSLARGRPLRILFYVDGTTTNFGDDLNRWMWSDLLGIPLDVDDGSVLLGIGTVLSKEFVPPGLKYFVLGSGAGYDAPPADFGSPAWTILAVRGPLTAAALSLPPEKAVTDAAALIRLLPDCQPLPEHERSGILFMPHYEVLPAGNWRQVCALAGFEFLDPLADSRETLQRIRKAKLVIADAMHAAIVADALRVPWIPVALSPKTNTFKWMDWTLSLDLDYNPTVLPASSLLEAVHNFSLRFRGNRYYFRKMTPFNAIRRFQRMKKVRTWNHWAEWSKLMFLLFYAIPRRIVTSPILRGFRMRMDAALTQKAAKQLQAIPELPASLSNERVFQNRLEVLAILLQKLQSGR
jgi:succinoglycan biosynthesis protein ExoV